METAQLRELDAAVAEKVMGLEVLYQAASISDYANSDGSHPQTWVGFPRSLPECQTLCERLNDSDRIGPHLTPHASGNPRYSESIEAAMQVVEKMANRGALCTMKNALDGDEFEWIVEFEIGGFKNMFISRTLPKAICSGAVQCLDLYKQ